MLPIVSGSPVVAREGPWPVVRVPAVFSAEACDAIRSLARPDARGAMAYGGAGLAPVPGRESQVGWLWPDEGNAWVYEALDAVLAAVNEAHFGLTLRGIEVAQLSRYAVGDRFPVHTDFGFLHATRQLSMTVQLSPPDAYEGGDLSFLAGRYGEADASWDEEIGVASRAQGSVTVFPAHLAHRVAPVTAGERWSLVVWIRGEPFE
jgi:PKHD-type hydroxylase